MHRMVVLRRTTLQYRRMNCPTTGVPGSSARVAELLFVDFDGLTADPPDDVISDGLDGGVPRAY